MEYMTRINETLEQLNKTEEDVTDIVPIDLLTSLDSEFFNYIVKSNNRCVVPFCDVLLFLNS